MADAVSAAAATTPSGKLDTSALGRSRLAESFDTFLSLLTTQLKNQDPLSPLDSNQFTQQIVQMTGVEQQLLTNDLLKSLVTNTQNGVSTAVSLIGKDVRAVSSDAKLQDGKAAWTYNLGRDAGDVKIEVLDSKGRVVKAFSADEAGRKAGDHAFTWDGKDATGLKRADGDIYTLRVTAKDGDFANVGSIIYVDGRVTGVEQSNGETLLTVGGSPVPWSRVTTIKQPPVTTTAAATAPATAGG